MRVHPAQQHWWFVVRRYTVEDGVYVEAGSATEAKAKAAAGEYEDISAANTVGATTYRKAVQIPGGKPQDLWDTEDWEAVERFASR